MRLALVGLLALTFAAGCDQPSAHKTVGASSSGSTSSGSGGSTTSGSGSSGSTGTSAASGSTGASSTGSTGSSGSLLGMCMACSANTDCQSGYCDRATSRCNSSIPCDTDPSVCTRSGLTCDNQARICVCNAGTGTSGSSSSSASSSSGSSGTSGTCSCDGCTNLGLGCDVANACSCTVASTTGGTTGGSGGSTGTTCVGSRCVVYAETDHDLYQVDPTNPNNITHLCTFNGALGSTTADAVNDIAVRADGSVYAITKTDLYTVDPQSCAATWVAQVAQGSQNFNCLSFTSTGDLVAATSTGQVSLIDPTSGNVSSNVGTFGNSLGCSGDLVIVNNGVSDQIFATAKDTGSSSANDILVKLDPNTFHATKIGHSSNGWTGYKGIFGLGFWGGELYGFDKNGNVIQIDVGTGEGTLLTTTNPSVTFYGAGTTPLAPIVNR